MGQPCQHFRNPHRTGHGTSAVLINGVTGSATWARCVATVLLGGDARYDLAMRLGATSLATVSRGGSCGTPVRYRESTAAREGLRLEQNVGDRRAGSPEAIRHVGRGDCPCVPT